MPTKIIKETKVAQAFESDSRTTANTLYNGASAGSGIDTQDYEEALVIVNAGTFAGDASVTFACYEYTSDAAASSSAITGASFSAINSSNDSMNYTGSIQCHRYNRYMWVRAVKTGTGAADYGVSVVLNKKGVTPYANSGTNEAVFDV